MRSTLTFAVLSALLAFASAAAVQVKDVQQLRDALADPAVDLVTLASTVRVTQQDWPDVIPIGRTVALRGAPGALLDLHGLESQGLLLEVAAPGRLGLSSLTLAVSSLPSKGAGTGPVPAIISTGGSIVYDRVVFYASGPAAVQQQQRKQQQGSRDRQQQASSNVQQADSSSSAWRLQDWASGLLAVISCSAVADVQSCYTKNSNTPGSALAVDSASLTDALADPAVHSITVLQDVQLDPTHCRSSSRQQLVISRLVALSSCPGATLSFSGLRSCWLVASGGLLWLQPGLRLSQTAAAGSSSSSDSVYATTSDSTARSLLLGAVDMAGNGAVVMRDIEVQLASAAWQAVLQHSQQQGTLRYQASGPDSVIVHEWRLSADTAGQHQLQPRAEGVPLVAQTASTASTGQQGVAVSRRLLVQSQAGWLYDGQQQQQQQQQQQWELGPLQAPASTPQRQLLAPPAAATNGFAAATAPLAANASAAAPAAPSSKHSAEPMDAAALAAIQNSSYWVTGDSAAFGAAYPKGNCFPDFRFLAKDIVEFLRLIRDPATTHIELTGDITFTEELFPPDHANNQSLGINITQKLTIRACTGDVAKPIIVDVNNLQQQIYVYGEVAWEGNIKFVNSFPSQRRAGLFPLISILSVEGDGIISFRDLNIHGSESCPLFDLNDPFWDRYGESPLSPQFVPQRDHFLLRSPYEVVLLYWKFNKTAWVMKSQGTQGVVKAVGHGYWLFQDVLVTWSPTAAGPPQGGALVAAVVVPVVVALLLAAAGMSFVMWRRRRTKEAAVAQQAKDYLPSEQDSRPCLSDGYSCAGMQRAVSNTYDSAGSKQESTRSQSSINTQELIEEARRRMQVTAGGRKDTSIVLEGLLGEGTFGKVYRGTWQGTEVAVKTMLFPAAMSGKEKREKMAIMETAISSTLSHPNIVQTYTYVVKPLTGELALQAMEHSKGGGPMPSSNDDSDPSVLLGSELGENHGWEVRLVLELCDKGSLKDLLNAGGLRWADGRPDMVGIIATALDVARAMLHLHSENVIHSDLKARNVLLKSAGADARGFVAKVSDFGLSVRMDPTETHISNVYQGTLTHMAPEVLMFGKISRASDVYAFGILLWELYTAQQAFKGMPRALLGHEITKMGHRPVFPSDSPFDYQLLACRCWESDPAIRPSFQAILADLQRMATKLSMAGCDSASSLPMPPGGSNTCLPPPQQQQKQPQASAGGGIDPAKLHNWEPQTSLLDLCTNDSTHGSSLPATESGPGQASSSQQLQPHSMSWGTQSCGGGLWLGGEFAPSNVPSGVHLPPVHHGSDPVAAMPGLHEALAAAAAAQQQQQQQQQQPGAVLYLHSIDGSSSMDPTTNSTSSSGMYLQDGSSTLEASGDAAGPAAGRATAQLQQGGGSLQGRTLAQSSNMATIEEEGEQPASSTSAGAATGSCG